MNQAMMNLVHTMIKQGNSVTRDLPPTGSEATIFDLHILDIDSHYPYLLSGETTSHLTNKWRGTFQYFQHKKKTWRKH